MKPEVQAIVSPTARPTPNIQPASSPLRAAGKSTLYTVSHLVAPRAIAASRYESGTDLNASSEMDTMSGTAMSPTMMSPGRVNQML